MTNDALPDKKSTTANGTALCIGAIHWDTIAHADRPILRETSTPSRLVQKAGGVATNVARAMAKLDVKVALAGATGDDPAALAIAQTLEAENITQAFVKRSGFSTGQYLALHDPDGSLTAACVDDLVLREAPISTFDGLARKAPNATHWFVDANLTPDQLAHVIRQANDAGVFLAADAVSVAKAEKLQPHLDKIDILLMNRAEAAALVSGDIGQMDDRALFDAVLNTGIKGTIMTRGSDPLFAYHEGNRFEVASKATKVVDVTGAGDALVAGTLSGLARGLEIARCLEVGVAAAALTLASPGAVADTLSWQALQMD